MRQKIILTIAALAFAGCWSPSANRGSENATRTPSSTSTKPTASATAENKNQNMPKPPEASPKPNGFQGNVPSGFKMPTDAIGQRMLREYGAMLVARGVTPPPTIVFRDESEVSAFQASVAKKTETVGGVKVELQTAAMDALLAAVRDASARGKKITPANADSARRSYQQTVDNWKSRVDPGLDHWVAKGRISGSDASRIRQLSAVDQIPEIFRLEEQQIFFAKSFDKSIIYSVAPVGTSQHISMLALDVAEHKDASVRAILAEHGWFQTVRSDFPHFTYLGVKESELPALGLKKEQLNGHDFWVPEM